MKGKPLRAGDLDESSFRWMEGGFYVEAVLSQNAAADDIRALLAADDAAWSGGFWPPLMKVRKDGYVEESPLVEGSVASRAGVVSQPSTTTVLYVRGLLPADGRLLEDDMVLNRSEWVSGRLPLGAFGDSTAPPATVPVAAPPAAPPAPNQFPAQPAPMPGITEVMTELRAMGARLDAIQQQPTRALPGSGGEPPPFVPAQGQLLNPTDSVSTPYDHVSLFGMLLYDRLNQMYRARQGLSVYERDGGHRTEAFMRAVFEKAKAENKLDDVRSAFTGSDLPDQVRPVPFRAIDPLLTADNNSMMYDLFLRADTVMTSTLVGYGDELVPTLLNSVAWYKFRLTSNILGLFDVFDMPSDDFEWPVFLTGPKFRLVLETTDISQFTLPTSPIKSSKVGTTKVAFHAGEMGALCIISKQLFGAAGLNVADAVANQFLLEQATAMNYWLINGDERTTTSNLSNSADPTGTDYDSVLAIDGLRRMAQAADSGNDFAAHATISADTPATLAKLMGPRGIIGRDIKNLALICDPGSAYKYDALTAYQSINDVGPQATLLTGQVGSVKGVGITPCDEIENALSTGLYPADHTSGTTGTQIEVHRPGIKFGRRPSQMLDMMPVPWANGFAWWTTIRGDLKQLEDGHVAVGYNTTI